MEKIEFYKEKIKKEKIMSNDLLSHLKYKVFSKGSLILRQGQKLDAIYILVEGRTKVCHTTANGNTYLCAFTKAISVIGEVEFFHQQDVVSDIYALEDCLCFYIDISQYQFIYNDLLFMRYLAYIATLKLCHSNLNNSISLNYPLENRLASYLIACQHENIIEENFVSVSEMIGSSYRQLQRILNDFCRKGYIIKIKRGKYKITNEAVLQNLGQDLYYL